ncbi:MAG: arsenosugar biosynthesis radical SAM protein ArsS [Gammaproteobacteria bacterium]|nr:arsenosugar biosynthesis radical SAM protein ArsS [Gammaproteobacteria bacterium]
MHATLPLLINTDFPPLKRAPLKTLQVNLGYRCNQQCLHCHVDASPRRTEEMSADNIEAVIKLLSSGAIEKLDLTGGAPELHPQFRNLVEHARALGVHVIDRCNLTILSEPGQQDLAVFLASHQVEVVASLPCYTAENVDGQRGKGVFSASIAGIKKLNELGYAQPHSDLLLNLVYNPGGAFLPPAQDQLESDYKQKLAEEFDIAFNHLFTITNMPIKRFGSTLISKGEFESYMQLLKSSCSAENIKTVMCRELISVDWQGNVFDCDFNQLLDLPLLINGEKKHISEISVEQLDNNEIVIADHCYGCTAGQGSSCGGALSAG